MTLKGFNIFPDQDRKAWEEKVTKDLKSIVLDSLKWELPACGDLPPLPFEPIYFNEDVKNNPIEVIKSSSGWLCGEKVSGKDLEQIIERLIKVQNDGVDGPLVDYNEKFSEKLYESLTDKSSLFILNERGWGNPNTLDKILRAGQSKTIVILAESVVEMLQINARAEVLNVSPQAGFSIRSKTAADLCSNILEQAEKFNEFVEKCGAAQLPRTLYVPMVIGLDYFPAIAALRAFRIVLANILDTHGKSLEYMPLIDTYVDPEAYTTDDPYINLIRGTVMAMAAVSGGSTRVTLAPPDSNQLFKTNSRNIHHLMNYESFLGQVADPASGSYYIDKMTGALAERVWSMMA